ncbi:Redoxin [Powellomyces hirtus]|nr:Redoxin [Powellomyces hirtus]
MSSELIAVGAQIPDAAVFHSGNPDAIGTCALPKKLQTGEFFKGKKVVLVFVPAAFSPTCQEQHIPAFIEHLAEFRSKGVDAILVGAADTVFTMDAWGKQLGAKTDIIMISDPYTEFAKKLGIAFETREGMGPAGLQMGPRTKRAALIADNGVVKWIGVDDKGLNVSSAQSVLSHL